MNLDEMEASFDRVVETAVQCRKRGCRQWTDVNPNEYCKEVECPHCGASISLGELLRPWDVAYDAEFQVVTHDDEK